MNQCSKQVINMFNIHIFAILFKLDLTFDFDLEVNVKVKGPLCTIDNIIQSMVFIIYEYVVKYLSKINPVCLGISLGGENCHRVVVE